MRGVVIKEFGPVESHRLEDLPDPVAGAGEVLIDSHAIGLNFPDSLMVQGLYQWRPERPFVPGRDAAGVVAAVGEGVTKFKVGDRVVTNVRSGAFAERIAAPEGRVYVIPDAMDFAAAAGMITIYATAYVALESRCRLRAGETVLVLGASGGVGLAAVEIAKAKGATVIAGATSDEKRALTLAHGADHAVDLAAADIRNALREQVHAVTDGKGVDIVIDPVGGDLFHAAMRTLAYDGRIAVVGFAAGGIPEAKVNYLLLKNLAITGVALDLQFNNEPETVYAAMEDLFSMFEAGRIRPAVTARFPLEEFAAALGRFGSGGVTGKMVMTTGRDG